MYQRGSLTVLFYNLHLRPGIFRRLVPADLQILFIRVIRACCAKAHRKKRILPDIQRKMQIIISAIIPLPALFRFPCEQIRPDSFRQIVIHHSIRAEDRRRQQVLTKHVLHVQPADRRVIHKLQDHRAHHRDACVVRMNGKLVKIGHQGALEVCEILYHFTGFFIKYPGDAVGPGSVKPAVGRQQAEGCPALVQVRRRRTLKSGNVMAPESKPAHRQGQAAAQCLCHGRIGCHAVTAPVDRELLRADRRAAREQHGIALSLLLLQYFKDTPVIDQGVIVVHGCRICSVVIPDIHRNPLAEVRLEAVDSQPAERAEFFLEPAVRVRIRKVHDPHAVLPVVGLPDALPVRAHQQITMLHRFVEQGGILGDVRIHPDADLHTLLMVAPDHSFRIRKLPAVPVEVAQAELSHPVAVIMENRQRNLPVLHPLDK